MQIFLNSAGGLALFLLAMLMMTEGLKAFARRHVGQRRHHVRRALPVLRHRGMEMETSTADGIRNSCDDMSTGNKLKMLI